MVRRSLIGVALQSMGYRIIPGEPRDRGGARGAISEVATGNHRARRRGSGISPASDAASIATDAATIGAAALWLQQGIRSPQARQIAIAAGLDYAEDKCLGTNVATMHFPGSIERR